jgi:hypothetical protein
LPDDWTPPQTWTDWTTQNCPGLDGHAVAQVFADYWHGVPGSRGTKLDWFATWRNWCRQEASRKRPAANGHSPVTQRNIETIREYLKERA